MNPIRVLIADDHALLRAGIRSLLDGLADIEVIAEAGDGIEALAKVIAQRPDIALLDIAMPRQNGLQTATRITEQAPGTRTIILSMHADEEYVREALQAGVSGYLLKDSAPTELELAIRAVARGETYLSPAVSKQVMADYLRFTSGEGPRDILTPRQREILQLIAEGQPNKVIAARLQISIKTVETHRTQLMDRLDIHDVAGLVRYAIRIGLVTSHE